MIEIVEKEPWYDNSLFTGHCWMYPTYMVKDGQEFFMFNRREPDDRWELEDNEARKRQLKENDGKYFRFNGFYACPFDMLKEIAERKHHFEEPSKILNRLSFDEKVVDFEGNRWEVSAAFFYRIYDEGMTGGIERICELLKEERFDDAMREIESMR